MPIVIQESGDVNVRSGKTYRVNGTQYVTPDQSVTSFKLLDGPAYASGNDGNGSVPIFWRTLIQNPGTITLTATNSLIINVADVIIHKFNTTGTSGDTVQVQNASNSNITDAFDLNTVVADSILRASKIYSDNASTTALKIVLSGSSFGSCWVHILGWKTIP